MKKILLIAALFASATLFASGHGGAGDVQCTIKYNECMANCSVKYGSDTECVAICKYNYTNCKAGVHTEDYKAPKSAESEAKAGTETQAHGHH